MWTFRTLRPMWEYRFFQQDFPDIFPPFNRFCNVVSPGGPFSRRYLYLPYQFPVSGLVHRFLIDCLFSMLPLPVPFSFARDFSTAAAALSTGAKCQNAGAVGVVRLVTAHFVHFATVALSSSSVQVPQDANENSTERSKQA